MVDLKIKQKIVDFSKLDRKSISKNKESKYSICSVNLIDNVHVVKNVKRNLFNSKVLKKRSRRRNV